MGKVLKDVDYWLFSSADLPTLARARNDIPVDIVIGVTEEEAKRICAQIKTRLKNEEFYEIYVRILVFFKDVSALEILHEWKLYFQEERRVKKSMGITCATEISLLTDAVKRLESIL